MYLGYIAETIIFLLSGVIIGSKINSHHDIDIFWDDYLKLFGLYIFLHLIRFGCLLLFYPILSRLGYGMSLKELVFLSYAGLRGAVGLTLALIVT
jgi:NhaP-type Na+/H+ or K+/H+ antiporter